MLRLAGSRSTASVTLLLALLAGAAPAVAAQAPTLATRATPKRAAFVAPTGSNVVTIVAKEYAFAMPDTVPAGLTTIRLRDDGMQGHHVFLVRLDSGRTLADFATVMKGHDNPPGWMHFAGGPNAAPPGGGESFATLDLAPGRYVAFCVIPAPDGVAHVAKGMIKELTVVPSGRHAPVPTSDVTITVSDYDYAFSRPLAAGRHTIRIENKGPQDHEMVLMRMPPGATIAQMAAWAEKPDGPPPLIPSGGITDIPPGETMFIHVDLEPGDYALICFVPDAKDGQPHVAHGMGKKITVQ